jgi:hypothetical protein
MNRYDKYDHRIHRNTKEEFYKIFYFETCFLKLHYTSLNDPLLCKLFKKIINVVMETRRDESDVMGLLIIFTFSAFCFILFQKPEYEGTICVNLFQKRN